MMSQVVGTCSICGGAVMMPLTWMSTIPPVPTCGGCGAVAAAHGPVIPMRKLDYQVVTSTGTAPRDDSSKS